MHKRNYLILAAFLLVGCKTAETEREVTIPLPVYQYAPEADSTPSASRLRIPGAEIKLSALTKATTVGTNTILLITELAGGATNSYGIYLQNLLNSGTADSTNLNFAIASGKLTATIDMVNADTITAGTIPGARIPDGFTRDSEVNTSAEFFNLYTEEIGTAGHIIRVSGTPSNGRVPTYNTDGTITWQTGGGGGGGAATNTFNTIIDENGGAVVADGEETLKMRSFDTNIFSIVISTNGTHNDNVLYTIVLTNIAITNFSGTLLDAQIAADVTRDAEWNTITKIETATGVNIILNTEIDSSAKIAAIVGDETGTGLLVLNTNATLVTPIIGSFTNANHNHQNVVGGGTLDGSAIGSGTVLDAFLPTGITRDIEWDTLLEIETAAGAINIIQSTEIDTEAKVETLANVNWIKFSDTITNAANWVKSGTTNSTLPGTAYMDSAVITNTLSLVGTSSYVELLELAAAPANPEAGYLRTYAKSDGFIYARNGDGTETKLSNEAAGSGDDVFINGANIVHPDWDDSTYIKWIVTGTNVTAYATNLTAAHLATDSVSADELNAAGVAAELEAAMVLQNIGGAVIDAQVPNTITIDLATTATTANAGDSATAFFSAGTIEDARLPVAMADKDFTGTVNIPNGNDPNTAAEGDISYDNNGDVLRGYDGTRQVALGQVIHTIQVTVITPNDLADAQRDAFLFWSNESGMNFVITGWKGWAGTANTSLAIETTLADGTVNAVVDAVELATGTGPFTGTDTVITAPTIANGSLLWLDFDDVDTPTYVKMTIYGYYDADVN